MPKCMDVANFFLWRARQDEDAGEVLTHLKLQKLLYYAQGFHLAMEGKPLFPEQIRAWEHGPVVPDVWHRFKASGSAPIPPPGDFDPGLFSSRQIDLLNDVYRVYGQFSAWRLRNMTHEEPPWKETGRGHVITHAAMKRYFNTLVVNDA